MPPVTLEFLTQQLELADQLLAGRDKMFEPQDLPGRFGRVVRAIDCLLRAIHCSAVLGGDWAVWHYGYVGRIAQDIDIALPAEKIDEFRRAASVAGFEMLLWPKLVHKETGVKVDILPEGTQPGIKSVLTPATNPTPRQKDAYVRRLRYINLGALIELKIARGWMRDDADVVELLRASPGRADSIREYLARLHGDYVKRFDELLQRAREQQDQ